MPTFVFDGHVDAPMRLWETPADLDSECPDRQVDLPRLQAGGVGGAVFAFFVPSRLDPDEGLEHVRRLETITRERLRSRAWAICSEPGEVEAATAAGRVGVVFGLENGRCLQRPGALDELLARQVRLVTLTHVASHEWCDAAGGESLHGGLSPAGEEIVRELAARRVLIDLSHVSDAAVEHVLSVVDGPVVASHSSARALCDHPRNLTDELARAIAGSGGLVMVNAFPVFLDPEAEAASRARLATHGPQLRALEARYLDDPGGAFEASMALFAADPLPSVSIDRYVDHILHLVGVVGEKAVGIGTDFDGIPVTPVGFEHPGCFPHLEQALARRGLDSRARRAILGENFLRVWDRVRDSG